ncbi:MAG: hypothetical protein AAF570_04965, partial [Bacteroidota bacterium]
RMMRSIILVLGLWMGFSVLGISDVQACCSASQHRMVLLGAQNDRVYFMEMELRRRERDICADMYFEGTYNIKSMNWAGEILSEKPMGNFRCEEAEYEQELDALRERMCALLNLEEEAQALPDAVIDCGYGDTCLSFRKSYLPGQGLQVHFESAAGESWSQIVPFSKPYVKDYFEYWDVPLTDDSPQDQPNELKSMVSPLGFGKVRRYQLAGRVLYVAHFQHGSPQFTSFHEARIVPMPADSEKATYRCAQDILHHGNGFDQIIIVPES